MLLFLLKLAIVFIAHRYLFLICDVFSIRKQLLVFCFLLFKDLTRNLTFSIVLECYKSACDIYTLVFSVLSFLLHSYSVLTNLLSEICHRFRIRPIVNYSLIDVAVLLFYYFSPNHICELKVEQIYLKLILSYGT